MPRGVPTCEKFDAKRRERYLRLLREGNSRTSAARGCGVSYRLVWAYRKAAPPAWRAQEAEAELEAVGLVEDAMHRAAREGNVTAQQVILYNRAPKRWRDRRNLQVSGAGKGGEVVVKVVAALPGENGNGREAIPDRR